MKRRLIGAAVAAVVLMILFVACSDETQIVAYERAAPVSDVRANLVQDNPILGDYVNVDWYPAKNAVNYSVYIQWDKSDDMRLCGSTSSASYSEPLNTMPYYVLPARYRFGVIARDFDSNHATSDIRWSNYIDIPLQ